MRKLRLTILTVKTESTWRIPGEVDWSVSLCCDPTGYFLVGREISHEPRKARRKKVYVEEGWAQKIVAKLKTLQIPPAPDFVMGCDGGFTELKIGGYEGGARYRWWSEPPAGWRELDDLAREVLLTFIPETESDKAEER